jgi:hypothetical protein
MMGGIKLKYGWSCGLHSLWQKVNGWGEGRGKFNCVLQKGRAGWKIIPAGPPARPVANSQIEFEVLSNE